MNNKLTKLLFLSTLVGTSLHATQFTCISKVFRENGGTGGKTAESRLVLTLKEKDDGSVEALKIAGHVTVIGHDENGVAERANDNYYSVFALNNLTNNPNYRPTVYTNHIQFKEVNEAASSDQDGGGMFGTLVVNKTRPENENEKFDAHYIFQSGDHLGGTIDYDCAI
jgi:hypothetical protein